MGRAPQVLPRSFRQPLWPPPVILGTWTAMCAFNATQWSSRCKCRGCPDTPSPQKKIKSGFWCHNALLLVYLVICNRLVNCATGVGYSSHFISFRNSRHWHSWREMDGRRKDGHPQFIRCGCALVVTTLQLLSSTSYIRHRESRCLVCSIILRHYCLCCV